jgi:selenoprotein W-related protein
MTEPKLTIEYCAPCNYLPRTLWQVQELVTALTGEVESVELIPADNGRYRVSLGNEVLFSKEVEGRFPEPEELIEAAFAVLGRAETSAAS